ncbi:MAG: hypothetical protein ACLT4C_04105 [Butyricicoccus sp.]
MKTKKLLKTLMAGNECIHAVRLAALLPRPTTRADALTLGFR